MKKYMIIVIFALTALALTSCGDIFFAFKNRQLLKSTYTAAGIGLMRNPIDFVVQNDRMLAVSIIEEEPDTVILDTGFSGGLAEIHTISELNDSYSKVKMQGATQKSKVYMKMDTVNLRFLWKHHTLKLDVCLNNDVLCGESLSKYPILGAKVIFPFEITYTKVNLNFTDNKITYYENNDDTTFDVSGYKSIKCKFKWQENLLYVYPVVNGIEYECLFDTGNNGYLILKNNKKAFEIQTNDIVVEGTPGISITGIDNMGKFVIRDNEIVTLGEEDFTTTVMYVPDIIQSNMGLKFISRFDWFFKSGLLYYKPRNVEGVDYQIKSPYRIIATDKGLMVIMKVVDDKNTLRFGDIITSVNGDKITAENICHYNELLNNAKDWNEFEIEISH